MKRLLPGPQKRPGRRLAGFLILSLGGHAVAFSLFRDPGEFAPIPPPSPGKVMLMAEADLPSGFAHLFEPSAIVFPVNPTPRLSDGVVLPWQDDPWSAQSTIPAPAYRPAQVGADAPLAVRAEESLGQYRTAWLPKTGPVKGRPVLKTWVEITGDLRQRKATAGLPLPGIKTSSALEPTTARIGVDEDGAVRFVFLEGTTGDPAVDREASSLLRACRFEPAPGQWIQWVRVRVLWAVEPPAGGKP